MSHVAHHRLEAGLPAARASATSVSRPREEAAAGRRTGVAARLVRRIAPLLLGAGSLAPAAPVPDYVPTGGPAHAQVVLPASDGRVIVAWIDREGPNDRVLAAVRGAGASIEGAPLTLYTAPSVLWSLKLEEDGRGGYFLGVSDSVGTSITTRVLRLDGGFRETARSQWLATTEFLPTGRMHDGNGHLFLSADGLSARGRFVNATTLAPGLWFTIQQKLTESSGYYGSEDDILLEWVTGLDTAIAPDGTGTAVYEFGRIRLRRFSPTRRLLETLLLDRAPWTPLIRTGETAVAVNGGGSTLLAWEWHAYDYISDRLITAPSIPAFKGVLPDGSLTPTRFLEPSSQTPDLKDRPAVALRPDGTGAVAWTERTLEGSRVWLMDLDAEMAPTGEPRLADDRPGFDTDKPMIQGDEHLWLSWRCTPRDNVPAEIGLLDLEAEVPVLTPPQVVVDGGVVRVTWTSPPDSRVTLWFSPDLAPGHAVALRTEDKLPGPRSFDHEPGTRCGFYWLSVD